MFISLIRNALYNDDNLELVPGRDNFGCAQFSPEAVCPEMTWAYNMRTQYADGFDGRNYCTGNDDFFNLPNCVEVGNYLCPLTPKLTNDVDAIWNHPPPQLWIRNDTHTTNNNIIINRLNTRIWVDYNQMPVRCSYDVESFTTFGDILALTNNFIATPRSPTNENRDILNEVIYPYFCSLESLDCPLDPLRPGESIQQTRCSRFTSTDPEGDLCRTWAATYPIQADAIKTTYCHRPDNIDKSECACINKVYDTLYNTLKKDVLAPDSCWYTPCSNETLFLIPASETVVVACPDVCGVIIKNYGDADIDLTDANIYVDCTKGQEQSKSITATNQQTITTKTIMQTTIQWIYEMPIAYWVIIGVIIFLIIVFSVLMFLK